MALARGPGARVLGVAMAALAACSGGGGGDDLPDAAGPPVCGDGVVGPGEVCDDGVNDRLGGGCLPGCVDADDSDTLFAAPLHEIAIEMPPAQWETLRHEVKSRHVIFAGADCRNRPITSPYNWYPGTVTIDGERFESVAVRKKGHLGSQTTVHPALKLDFDKLVDGRRYRHLDGFALGNDRQDASLVRTCTAYQAFAAAGLPAPRCTKAHVTVNGVEQGVYSLYEEVDHDLLARHFAQTGGNLYEGTANDFRPEFVGGFEQETNLHDTSRADLAAVMAALARPDSELPAALGAVVDLPWFYRFWAAETLTWHRDGYSGNANNFFLYADPAVGGRFRFLPWGADAALTIDNRTTVPDSVMAFSALTNRLYAIPATRDAYYATLDQVLASGWDPAALVARVDAIGAAITPVVAPADRAGRDTAAGVVKNMVSGQAGLIAAARASGPPAWTEPMRALPCRIPAGTVTGTFSTRWGTIAADAFASGTGTLTLDITGTGVVTATRVGARAGVSSGERLQIFGDTATRRYTMVVPYPDPDWFDPFSVVGDYPITLPPLSITIAESALPGGAVLRRFEVGEGTWTFTAASTTANAPVTGRFTAQLFLVP